MKNIKFKFLYPKPDLYKEKGLYYLQFQTGSGIYAQKHKKNRVFVVIVLGFGFDLQFKMK